MKLFNAIVNVAIKLPCAIVKDTITMGGALIDDRPQTVKTLEQINDDIFGKEQSNGFNS
jgi:hypothetical protein